MARRSSQTFRSAGAVESDADEITFSTAVGGSVPCAELSVTEFVAMSLIVRKLTFQIPSSAFSGMWMRLV